MTLVEERFGPYGGRYVPETLIAALDELTAAWSEAHEDAEFTLPPRRFGAEWTCELRTDGGECGGTFGPGAPVALVSRSLLLLRRTAA